MVVTNYAILFGLLPCFSPFPFPSFLHFVDWRKSVVVSPWHDITPPWTAFGMSKKFTEVQSFRTNMFMCMYYDISYPQPTYIPISPWPPPCVLHLCLFLFILSLILSSLLSSYFLFPFFLSFPSFWLSFTLFPLPFPFILRNWCRIFSTESVNRQIATALNRNCVPCVNTLRSFPP